MNRFINYIKETKGEMKHVNWPNRRQVAVYTILVVAISLLVAGYLGLFDWIFTESLQRFVI